VTDPAGPAGTAWSLFLTANAVLVEEIERRLAAAGLPTLDWYDALWALERAEGQRLRMHEFAYWMVTSRSNITRLIDRLETAGLVRRERTDEDRRGAYAVLSPEGRRMRKRMWLVYEKAIGELFEQHLSATELRHTEVAMHKLIAANRIPLARRRG
jgi:DNA-binding MarR family transcriptional regulator